MWGEQGTNGRRLQLEPETKGRGRQPSKEPGAGCRRCNCHLRSSPLRGHNKRRMASTQGEGKYMEEKKVGAGEGESQAGKKLSFPASASWTRGVCHTSTKGPVGLDWLARSRGGACCLWGRAAKRKCPLKTGSDCCCCGLMGKGPHPFWERQF